MSSSTRTVRGVWGEKSNRRISSAGGDDITEFVVARINAVGLDGAICAEYISSLVELYKGSPGERDAAINEFLSDSIASSSIVSSEKDRTRFVDETIAGLNQRLTTSPPASATPSETTANNNIGSSSKPKAALFKKGIKITGTALKEVVGNVKPSFVQRYSDDETAPPSIPSAAKPVVMKQYFHQESAEVQQKPPTVTVVGRRKMKGAREIGPDEDWDVTSSKKNQNKAVVSPPLVTNAVNAVEALVQEQVVIDAVEEVVQEQVAINHVDQISEGVVDPNALMFSNDMLMSFDFKFEGEDDATPPPMELFREMFSSTEKKLPSTSVPSAEIDETSSILMILPPPGGLDARIYSSLFLLEVRRLMRISENGIFEIPIELKSLTRSVPAAAAPQTKVVYSDNNWRTVKPKTITPGTPDPVETSFAAAGAWRASGYGQRWNGNKSNNHPKTTSPPPEEGFW